MRSLFFLKPQGPTTLIILLSIIASRLSKSYAFTLKPYAIGLHTSCRSTGKNAPLVQNRVCHSSGWSKDIGMPSIVNNKSRSNIYSVSDSSEGDAGETENAPDGKEKDESSDSAKAVEVTTSNETPSTFFSKFKNMFKGSDDGLTFKQKLGKMGLSVLLSYGWVSNMSYSVTVSLAWFGFSKKTGLSPLAPGQWPKFLTVYAGFYVFNNFVRPIRLTLSVGVSRWFDDAVAYIQKKTNFSKSVSIGIMVFLANVCGTFAAMGIGIFLASSAAGVPIFPPKA